MSLRIKTDTGERWRNDIGGKLPYRSLFIERQIVGMSKVDWPHLDILVWQDGKIEFETFHGYYDCREDEPPLIFSVEESPDVVLAIQEFLRSL